jgi:hypothetical protein
MNEENQNLMNLNLLEDFIERLHEKEMIEGQIRRTLYDMIFNIDDNTTSPIVYKTILPNTINTHRTTSMWIGL